MYDDVVPTRRVYPQRIVPWDGFPAQQAEMWRLLLSTRSATGSMDATSAPFAPFASRRAFSSQHSVDYSMEIINRPGISGGAEFWRAIEDPVRWLVGSVFDDAMLRRRFGPCRAVGFAMHYGYNVYGFTDTHDGYSVRMADGTRIPVTAAVHIMPDKLSPDEIFTGLAGATVDPGRDIINRDRRDAGDSAFVFASKTLTTAAVTKLFAYMVRKCVRYGYICTGDVLVFLHIPGDDPTTALYHVCVPDVDVGEEEDDNSHLLRTAAAQVFAFTLQAFCAPPPTTSWVRAAHLLDKWEFSYEGVLSGIPTRVRETKEHALPYRPNHGRGCMRCPSKASSSVAGKRKRRAAEDEDTASDKGHNEHGTKKPRPAQCLSTGTC
ncbi:hypothetical protein SCUCBS95973_004828 [Sporothrix curviconia]|uniref:Fungal-type protein kinase domain-containing protein n=1 Tax=Sporothrix curviconia TaxID=1260050 RepID=A0ABP0BTS0_9PEZI